jgi:hypothetical protein
MSVYNIDYSSSEYCYYTLSPDNADIRRINKSDILIIKLADGTKIDPTAVAVTEDSNGGLQVSSKGYPGQHAPVTHKATSKVENGKSFEVTDDKGQILCMKILSEQDRTLSVTKPMKGIKYDRLSYIIPEYVDIDGTIYTVVSIEKNAFKGSGIGNFLTGISDTYTEEIILPATLTEIGDYAFSGLACLHRIIIPDGVESIGERAFFKCGSVCEMFEQVYIPESVKFIGSNAFRGVSKDNSVRGFFQGYISLMPPYITTGNCKDFGIDEEAVENYYMRRK